MVTEMLLPRAMEPTVLVMVTITELDVNEPSRDVTILW